MILRSRMVETWRLESLFGSFLGLALIRGLDAPDQLPYSCSIRQGIDLADFAFGESETHDRDRLAIERDQHAGGAVDHLRLLAEILK